MHDGVSPYYNTNRLTGARQRKCRAAFARVPGRKHFLVSNISIRASGRNGGGANKRLLLEVRRDVEKHLAKLRDLRWLETRPHTSRNDQFAQGPARGKLQAWRADDPSERDRVRP
jgi:hypothetical protein